VASVAIPSALLPEARLSLRAQDKAARRLLPLLFVCYVLAYLDRVNVGFAQLTMGADLGFSNTVYGLGAGVFFIGYFLFEIPSNLILRRVGARVWIARIMITWGALSALFMTLESATGFYVLRFLLGAAEAGFFPGVIYYLTQWFPAQRQARIVALFMTAIAVSGVIGGPLSGWILAHLDHVGGLKAWQWLFLVEGLPSVVIGVVVLLRLDDDVAGAGWLDAGEKAALHADLAAGDGGKAPLSLAKALRHPQVLLYSLVYFCLVMGLYGVSFWLPQLIKAAGVAGVLAIGLTSALPFGAGAIAMVIVGYHSDRSGERRWHLIGSALIGAIGLVASAQAGSTHTVAAIAALCVGTAGILSALPLFWSLPNAILAGVAAAAGIALINSFGNLAGFVSPYLVGLVKDAAGSTLPAMYGLSACLAAAAVLVMIAPNPGR
jgi:MFS family permease